MYYSMTGIVSDFFGNGIILDVHDICFEILVSHVDDYTLGEKIKVFLHQLIKEDERLLIGFKTLFEKQTFLTLVKVKGIGYKSALNILKSTSPHDLIKAINSNDIKFLKKLPGIGNKGATQLIFDLKGNICEDSITDENNEVKEALKQLGFKTSQIDEVLKKIPKDVESSNDILAKALKMLRGINGKIS